MSTVSNPIDENAGPNLMSSPSALACTSMPTGKQCMTPGSNTKSHRNLSGLRRDVKRAERVLFSPKSAATGFGSDSSRALRTPVASNKLSGSRLGSGLKSGPVRVKTPSRKPSSSASPFASSNTSPRSTSRKTTGGPSSELLRSTKNSVAGRYQGCAGRANVNIKSPRAKIPKATSSKPTPSKNVSSKQGASSSSSSSAQHSRPPSPPPSNDMDISAITDASLYANLNANDNNGTADDGSVPSLPPPEQPTLKSTTLLPPTPPSAAAAATVGGFSNPSPSSYIVNMPPGTNVSVVDSSDGTNTVGSLDSSIVNNPGWQNASLAVANGSIGEGRCGDPVAKVFQGSDCTEECEEDDAIEEKKEELRRGGGVTPVHALEAGEAPKSLGVRQLSSDLEILKMDEGGKKSPKLMKPKAVKVTIV